MTSSLIRLGVFIGWLLLCSAGAAAQTGAALAGTGTDPTGDLVVGAEVRVLNLASGRESLMRTDAAGKYELKGLPNGSYQISVRREGFAAAARGVTFGRAESLTE